MNNNTYIMYLVIGFGLLGLIPVAESIGENLATIATILVVGYWASMGVCFLIYMLKNILADSGIVDLIFNIWLFVSLMCVAVGILAIVDEGVYKVPWAACLVFYGSAVAFLNRKEL